MNCLIETDSVSSQTYEFNHGINRSLIRVENAAVTPSTLEKATSHMSYAILRRKGPLRKPSYVSLSPTINDPLTFESVIQWLIVVPEFIIKNLNSTKEVLL